MKILKSGRIHVLLIEINQNTYGLRIVNKSMGRNNSLKIDQQRRRYVKAVGTASMVGMAGCLGGLEPGGGGDSYKGAEITFATSSLYDTPWKDLASKFQENHDISVKVTSYAQSEMLTKLQNQLRSRQASFDVFISDVIWTGSLMAPEFVEPLDTYLNDSKLGQSNYDFDDHLDIFGRSYGKWNGTIYGLPWYGDIMSLSVRKDVLEKHAKEYRKIHDEDILPPSPQGYKNYDQFNRVAKFMNERGWKIGLEGKRGWNIVYYYPNRFAAETGNKAMLDDQGKPRLDTPGATKALQHMIDQTAWALNPLSSGYTQSRDQFLGGKTWAVEQWGTATTKFVNEYGWEQGLRVTLTPGGYPNLGGWGILINSFSTKEKKKAAFVFAQWATSKKIDKYAYKEHGVSPTRKSSFTKQIKQENPLARYLDPEANPGIKTPSLRPRNPKYQQLGDSMQVQISEALSGGKNAPKTMQSIQQEWQSTMSDQ